MTHKRMLYDPILPQRAGRRPPRHVSADLWRRVRARVAADGLTLDQVVPALYERFVREGL